MKIATIDNNHLISLDTQEALMMLRLLHSARLHGPTVLEQELGGDAQYFLRELTKAILATSGAESKSTALV